MPARWQAFLSWLRLPEMAQVFGRRLPLWSFPQGETASLRIRGAELGAGGGEKGRGSEAARCRRSDATASDGDPADHPAVDKDLPSRQARRTPEQCDDPKAAVSTQPVRVLHG